MFSIFLIFSIIGILLILFLCCRRKYYILSWKIGGPLGYPILGIGLDFCYREKILGVMLRWRNKYGPVFLGYLGLTPVVVISDPIAAEKILTSIAFVNKSFIYHGVRAAVGDGLFSSDYLRWNKHRKLLNPAFNHQILLSFFPIFNREVKVLVNNLSKSIGKGPIDMHFMLEKLALDTACQTTMGKVMNFQNGKNSDILSTYHNLTKLTTQRIFVPWYTNDFLYQFAPAKKQFDSAKTGVANFVGDLIEEKIKRLNSNKINDIKVNIVEDDFSIKKAKNNFLDQAFKLMESNSFTKSDVEAESNTMVVAAYETTANVIYTILMCLAMFPKYQDRVYDEILSIFPEKEFEATYDDTQQLVYLEMVINETMRVLAPVPLIARKCTEDFDFGNGVTIPKDTQISIDIFNMQRCEKVWGPKCKTFYPDHFLKDNFVEKHPYSFMPFTKGLRNCIGWRYAMMSLKVSLSQILRSYRFTTDYKFENLNYVENVSLKFTETPLLKVHERNM